MQEKNITVTCKEISIRIIVDFSMETLKAGRAQGNSFQVLKDYDNQHKIIYSAKLSAKFEGERKTFYNTRNLKKNLYPTNQY